LLEASPEVKSASRTDRAQKWASSSPVPLGPHDSEDYARHPSKSALMAPERQQHITSALQGAHGSFSLDHVQKERQKKDGEFQRNIKAFFFSITSEQQQKSKHLASFLLVSGTIPLLSGKHMHPFCKSDPTSQPRGTERTVLH